MIQSGCHTNGRAKGGAWTAIGVTLMLTASVAVADCDRDCLIALADDYVDAMVTGAPERVPLSDGVRIVENLERIGAGEGLWSAATGGPDDFRIVVPDVHAQQVGAVYVLEANGEPAQLGLRLKLEGREIAEAEHIVVYSLRDEALPNLARARAAFSQEVAEPYRDSRARLIQVGLSYYDALDLNNGSLAPLADECVRHENGLQTARNPIPADGGEGIGLFGSMGCARQLDTQLFGYISSIDHRRVPIADIQTGLVFGLSHFRHAMDKSTFPIVGVPGVYEREFETEPFDLPAIHVYKVRGGQIYEIEALGVTLPYNSSTGWE